VALVNRDELNERIAFTEGGDYRSGRQARWRFEVRDENAALVPQRKILFGVGGGIFTFGELAPGERWKTKLQMASFVAALPPGRYAIRLLYHDSVCIADEDAIDGLIVSSSAPVTLTIKPLELATDDVVSGATLKGLLAGAEQAGRLRVVAGTYGAWAHKFVPPESAQGKILAMGLGAVPPLLDELENPQNTPARRALIFSLLFSLTGQNDPREAGGALGAHESADGPWAVWGDGGGGIGLGGSMLVPAGTIDPEAQNAFAKRWMPWKQYVRIKPARNGP
jgi:hypothetical protein